MEIKSAVVSLGVLLGLVPAAGLPAQGTNPPYLSEIPSVERILREIKGGSPDETAARQMGTFLQFKGMIETMAGGRRYRNQLTADEQRFIALHYGAYWEIAKTKPEYQKFTGLKGFDIDPQWRNELFNRYFSPEFRAVYDGVERDYKQRIAARAQADTQNMLRARAEVAEYERRNSPKPWQRTLARCIASGRSESTCLSEEMVKGFKDLFGSVLPGGRKAPTGLRLSGVFSGQRGFGLTFWDQHAVVACGQLVNDERAYTVDVKNGQVVLSVRTSPKVFELLQGASKPVVLTMGADGRLTGPGPTDFTGRVIVGYRQFTRHYDDGRVVPMTEPIYENRTVRCNVGVLALSGPSPAIGKVSEGLAVGLDLLFGGGDKTPLRPAPTGLRLGGEYGTQSAFDLEFHPHAVIVGCGEAVIAREYSVRFQDGRAVVRVQHGGTPFAVEYRPDGNLAGSGSVAVSGKMLAGQDANGELVWAPMSGTCQLGLLPPAAQSAVAGAGPRAGPVPAAPAPAPESPARGAATPAPSPSASRAAPLPAGAPAAVLSVATGFATPAGRPNPLGKAALYLLKTSYEGVLAGIGLRAAAGSSAVKAMVTACERQAPECAKAVLAMASNAVAVLLTDSNGNGDFAPVPAGTYYVVGLTALTNQPVIWNLKVDLHAGPNRVALDQRNAARLD